MYYYDELGVEGSKHFPVSSHGLMTAMLYNFNKQKDKAVSCLLLVKK